MNYTKQSPEVLMTVVFVICLCGVFYANHVHNNAMVQWAQNLAGQAFASIATLVVKGAFGQQQTTVATPSQTTTTTQKEGV
jgi:hypothetical protein